MVLHVENAALLYHSLKQACAAGALVQDPLMGALMQHPKKMQGSRSAQKLVLNIWAYTWGPEQGPLTTHVYNSSPA